MSHWPQPAARRVLERNCHARSLPGAREDLLPARLPAAARLPPPAGPAQRRLPRLGGHRRRPPPSAAAPRGASQTIVISQVYGGGGNSNAAYQNDYVELHNPTTTPFDTTGWTIQYASAAGTTWQTTALTGAIGPGRHYLVQLASAAAVFAHLDDQRRLSAHSQSSWAMIGSHMDFEFDAAGGRAGCSHPKQRRTAPTARFYFQPGVELAEPQVPGSIDDKG